MTEESAVKVCVRVRPLIQREQGCGEVVEPVPLYWRADKQAVHQLDDGNLTKTFNFDRVFSADESTNQLYQEIAKPLVVSTVDEGYNGTIFAYGQTSSGKTFTMMGSNCEPGVIPLAMEDVFATIKKCPKKEFLLRVSYMEIYNETVTDLLCDSWKRKPLEIREGNYKNVYVADLTEELVTSAEQALAWIRKGEKNRHYGKTKMNQRSSRSHTIFRMILESRERSDPASGENADGAIIVSHLNLVDLAGAERASQTGAEGARLKEGCNINRSLFTLGQVIKKLSEENQGGFTNYRDSKLTRILQNSLGGNAKTVIVCTITSAAVDETLSTLQFASTAKRMKNDPHVTEVSDDGALLRRYRNEIVDLKRRLEEVSSVTRTTATEKEVLAQLLQEKDQLQREQEDRIRNLTDIIVTSSNFVAVEKKVPKRRVTWGGKLMKGALIDGVHYGDGEFSFAEPSVKKRKGNVSVITDYEGDEFDTRWEIPEEPTFDGEMSQSSVTVRGLSESTFCSPLRVSELSEKVACLEQQLEAEAQEKQEALEAGAALEKRVAELQTQLEAGAALEKRVAELQTQLEAEAQEKQEALEAGAALEKQEALEAGAALEKRVALEAGAALEKRVAELQTQLEAEAQEKQEALEAGAALEKRVVELQTQLEAGAALEKRVAELQTQLEAGAALEKRVAELQTQLEAGAALEKRVVELQTQLQAGAALEKRVVELQTQLEAGAALEKRVVELQTQLEAGAALEKRVVELQTQLEAGAALEKRVVELQTQLEAEAQEKQEALEAGAALEKRVAELQTQLEATATQAAFQEAREEYKKDLGETIQLCEALVSEKANIAAENVLAKRECQLLKEENGALKEENRALKHDKEHLLKEMREKSEQDEFDALEQESAKQYETELMCEIASLKKAAALHPVRVRDLEAELTAMATELKKKEEWITELQSLSGQDLAKQVQQLRRSVDDAEALSRDARKDWAFLRSENLALQERDAMLTADYEKMQKEVQVLQHQLEAEKSRFKNMQNDLQRELLAAFEENAKMTALLDGKVPKSLIDSLELERKAVEMKRELEMAQEREAALQEEVQELVALRELPVKVDQLMRQICDLTDDLCSAQAGKESGEVEVEKLAAILQQTQQQLTDVQDGRRIAEQGAAELKKQLQDHQADNDQLLKSLEDLNQEVVQSREVGESMNEKLRLQQHTVKDLERELSEKQDSSRKAERHFEEGSLLLQDQIQQLGEELDVVRRERDSLLSERADSAQRWEKELEKLITQVTSLTQEREELQEILEGLRDEKNQLKSDLQENEEMVVPVQEELRPQQQNHSEEEQTQLQQLVQSQNEELDRLRAEASQLKCDLQENVEMMIENQEELRVSQEKIREQQKTLQDLEAQIAQLEFKLETSRAGESLPNLKELQNQLQKRAEELEGLRSERNQLKSDLQENVEMMIENQAELRVAQDKISEQQKTMQDLEARVGHMDSKLGNTSAEEILPNLKDLQDHIQQLGVELDVVCRERDSLLSERADSAQRWEEKLETLNLQVTSLTQEREKLQEVLEELRGEKNQLKSNLQKNEEMVVRLQEELRQQQQLTLEQQNLSEEAKTRLQQQVLQLCEELEGLRSERIQLKSDLQDNVEMMIENQEELRVAQEKIFEQHKTMQNLEAQIGQMDSKLENSRTEESLPNFKDLQNQMKQLGEELDVVCRERDSLLSERTDSAQRWEEKLETLNLQVTSLTREREELQEILEGLRNEKNQLKSVLQENEEMVVQVRKELRQQQQLNLEQQDLREEAQAQLQQRLQKRAEELEGLRSERNQLKSDLQENVEMMIENQEELRVAQDKISEQQKTMQDLEARVGQIWGNENAVESVPNIKDLQNQIQQLGEELDVVCRERDSLLSERTDSAQRWEEELEKLNFQVTSLTREREELQEILEGLRNEKNQLKSDLQENIEMMIENQEELRVSQEKIREQQKTLQDLEAQIAQLEFKLETSRAGESLPNLKELQNQIQQLGVELDVVRSERDSLLSERADSAQRWEEKLGTLNSQVTSLTREREELQEILEGLRNEKNQLKSNLQKNEEMVVQVQEELRLQQQQLTLDQQKLGEEAQIQLQQQLHQQNEELVGLKSERSQLKMDLQQNVEMYAENRRLLHSVQEELKLQLRVNSDLTAQSGERVACLEQQIQQLGVELDVVCRERDSLLSEKADSAQRWEEKLNSQVTSLTQEREKLQEVLEELRGEKNQLKSNLQKNEETVVRLQEELGQQQQLTLEQQKLCVEAQTQLEQQKLCVEAQTRLEQQSSQLLSEANQRPGLSEGTGFRLRHRLQETEKRLQELCEKFQTFRAQGLAAVPELTRPFDEASLAQNELVFRFLHTIPKPTRRLYINFRKSTRDLKDLLVETATAYAGMAKLHWQQCEEQMRHNLACFEEKRIQDLLLPRAKAPAGCLAVPDFQETWDQRLSSLLEKVEVYPQNAYRLAVLKLKEASLNSQTLSSLLAELEEGLAQVLPTLSQELPELERTNAGLRELCAGPSINLPALEDLLQQQLARRTELVQSKKAIYQRLCQQYNRADGKLQSFRVESRREIAGERGRSLALLRTSDTASVQSDVLLVKQLQQAEQTIKTLQEAQAEVERNASSQAEATERLRAQLQEARAQLQERGLSVQTLKEQLEAQKRQGIPPSTAALEEMKSKLVRMELERTALTSSHQEEVESLTALLNHKEEALRKLKETLRKTQSQCDDSFVMDGPSCTKVSTDGKWRNTQSTVQTERAKRQEEELQYLQGLVIGLREEVSKWKGRALNLKNKDLLNHMKSAPSHTPPTKSRCPLTPTKRNLVLDPSKPEHMPTSSPTGLDLAPNLDSPDPEKSTPTSGSPCSPDRGVGGTVGEDKTAEWWPLSPGQQDNCKAQ